jgi:hypothetical protein
MIHLVINLPVDFLIFISKKTGITGLLHWRFELRKRSLMSNILSYFMIFFCFTFFWAPGFHFSPDFGVIWVRKFNRKLDATFCNSK